MPWQSDYRSFADEVAEVTGRFGSFLGTANELAAKLRKKAGPLDDYLGGP
ncbi:hypothetical protein [Frankia sp. QA3]|nr:hypothetical protein [Frankia sp. QA3]EIV92471.1 hypothetical protein FraQA3DRAFT_2039 [Frankia sp. QA3]